MPPAPTSPAPAAASDAPAPASAARGEGGASAGPAAGRRRLLLGGIALLALAVRLPGIGESLWLDELFTSSFFVGHPMRLLHTLFSDIHPPAYFVFVHFWIRAFGDSELALRLPPLLSGLASVLLVARIGTLAAGPRVGTWAAFLLAASPVHAWYSVEARPYSTCILLTLVATLAFQRLYAGRVTFGWTLAWALSLAGLVFTHYYAAAFLPAFALLGWRAPRAARRRILWGAALVLAPLVAYLGTKLWLSDIPTRMPYLRAFTPLELWKLGFAWFLTGNVVAPEDGASALDRAGLLVLQAAGVLVFARGLRALWRRDAAGDAPGRRLVLLGAVLPAFLLALTLVGRDETYIERSALPALPFFVLVVAAGLASFRPGRPARAAAVSAVAVSALLLALGAARRERWTVYKPNPDWRAAAAWLSPRVDASEGALVMGTAFRSPTALSYYEPRVREAVHVRWDRGAPARLLARTDRALGADGFPGAWVHARLERLLAGYVRHREEIEARTRVQVVDLWRLPEAADAGRLFAGGPRGWLLCRAGQAQRALVVRRVLEDPEYRVVASARFRELELYELERREAAPDRVE